MAGRSPEGAQPGEPIRVVLDGFRYRRPVLQSGYRAAYANARIYANQWARGYRFAGNWESAPAGPADARVRARELLYEFLDERERSEYEATRRLMVRAQSRRSYLLVGDTVWADDGPLAGASFCIQTGEFFDAYPTDDAVLARKLMLETNEARFLLTAVMSNGVHQSWLSVLNDLYVAELIPDAETRFRARYALDSGWLWQ